MFLSYVICLHPSLFTSPLVPIHHLNPWLWKLVLGFDLFSYSLCVYKNVLVAFMRNSVKFFIAVFDKLRLQRRRPIFCLFPSFAIIFFSVLVLPAGYLAVLFPAAQSSVFLLFLGLHIIFILFLLPDCMDIHFPSLAFLAGIFPRYLRTYSFMHSALWCYPAALFAPRLYMYSLSASPLLFLHAVYMCIQFSQSGVTSEQLPTDTPDPGPTR